MAGPRTSKTGGNLLEILNERLARGEISEPEYEQIKNLVFHNSPPSPARTGAFDKRDTLLGIGPGSVLNERYEVVSEIGRGGMGVVYKARDLKLETDVAVKVLPGELARDPRAIQSLKEEAKVSMCLSHPNIMRLHTFEEDVQRKFLVMELVDGESLQTRLGREGKLKENELVDVALQICEGLCYAHGEKVIHRDLKPSNIVVSSSGRVKIMDFGIARIMKDSMTLLTGPQTTGTLVYMSPEQIEGRGVDQRSDIYSLGVVLYELLSGEPPFCQGDITHQHLRVSPKPLSRVSVRMNQIVMRCLEKNKDRRFQSSESLCSALTALAVIGSEPSPHEESKQELPSLPWSRERDRVASSPGKLKATSALAGGKPDRRKWGAISAILLLSALLILISLIGYDARDPSFANIPQAGYDTRNFAGSVGAYFSQAVLWFLGLAAFFLPFFLGYAALMAVLRGASAHLLNRVGKITIGLLIVCPLLALLFGSFPFRGSELPGGGIIGALLLEFLVRYLSTMGSFILLALILVLWVFSASVASLIAAARKILRGGRITIRRR